jgi:sugar phosphate isomerase/epimerase
MTTRLGIEQLSVFGLPPVAYVDLAADLGCQCISVGLTTMPYNPHGYAPWSLRDDPALRREMIAAMRDRGVAISLGEGCTIRAGREIADMAGDLDLLAELGAERINAVSLDPDRARSFDQFAELAELAAAREMVSTVELCPVLTIATLADALALVAHVGRRDFGLLLDTMHLARSGTTAADLAALDPALISYVQLCDAPLVPTNPDYMDEATFARMVPGEGELPLAAYLAALPALPIVSLEVPLRTEAEAGVAPEIRLGRAIAAARKLLAA